VEVEKADYQLKPMNCPGHILIYKAKLHSYRDLPVRLAELGTVYRYERSGVLHGLLRVRGLHAGRRAHFLYARSNRIGSRSLRRFCFRCHEKFGFDNFEVELSDWTNRIRKITLASPKTGTRATAALADTSSA